MPGFAFTAMILPQGGKTFAALPPICLKNTFCIDSITGRD
jgi:hypothetical protein